jgi:hypothetical protein
MDSKMKFSEYDTVTKILISIVYFIVVSGFLCSMIIMLLNIIQLIKDVL